MKDVFEFDKDPDGGVIDLKIRVKKVQNGWFVESNGDERIFTSAEDVIRFLARVVGAGGCVKCDCKPEKEDG